MWNRGIGITFIKSRFLGLLLKVVQGKLVTKREVCDGI